MDTKAIIDLEQSYILQTYARPDFVLERGDGVHLFDTDGKQYLDFVSGLSVNALGYNNPTIGDAMSAQGAEADPRLEPVPYDSRASVGENAL